MKSLPALLLAFLVVAPTLQAQTASGDRPPQVAPKDVPGTDLPLIPETLEPGAKPPASTRSVPSAPKSTAKTAPKQSKTQLFEDEVQMRIRLRIAKNKAVADRAIQQEWDIANTARTDLERRNALKRYYTLLYARIRKIDPTVSSLAAKRQADSLRRLEQTRIDPTEPLDPAERSERIGSGF